MPLLLIPLAIAAFGVSDKVRRAAKLVAFGAGAYAVIRFGGPLIERLRA